ncbi:unnamed protein product [Peronospora farinosa]|uniref:Uncharacterized protein n=1 Tax=Peronospora farinosa TaxID=134698 RepID=A0AAV0ULX4_9STRA|nr:unnamed protein product [Peronospora farinosa]
MFRSRNGRFALNKTGVIAFILETNAPSVAIVNTTEVPIVDLAAENLAISVANMIESLLELSTALGDERSPSAKGGPSDPKMTEFLPPILPHELVQLKRNYSRVLLAGLRVCLLAPRSLLMAVPVIWLYVEVK